MLIKLKHIIILLMLVGSQRLYSQLIITESGILQSTWNIDSVINKILIGNGVEVSNCTFNGSTANLRDFFCNAMGIFSTGDTLHGLGMTDGIILSTGHVGLARGPNQYYNGNTPRPCANAEWTDPVLEEIATGTLNSCATIEFDFSFEGDSLKFRYVFASEEYPEWVCTGYNDVFGFFITGPNPIHPDSMYVNHNLALVPGTDIPISINSVNIGEGGNPAQAGCDYSNSQYFIPNDTCWWMEYDGYTTVLTAQAAIVPCQTYHIRMAIANVSDDTYESAVFIEAESFSANLITTQYLNPTTPANPLDIHEACYGIDIVFSRPKPMTYSKTIPLIVQGTATNGEDYNYIPDSLIFPDSATSITLSINPIWDSIAEDMETIKLIYQVSPCGWDTVEIKLLDCEHLNAYVEYTPPIQTDTAVILTAMVQGGFVHSGSDYLYIWNTNDTAKTITVPTVPDGYYWFYAYDKCNNIVFSDTVWIGIMDNFATTSNDTSICKGQAITLYVYGGDSQLWSTGDTANTITVVPLQTTRYIVQSYMEWNGRQWVDIDTIWVQVKDIPEAIMILNPKIVNTLNMTTTVTDVSRGGTSRIFQFSDGTTSTQKTFVYQVPMTDSVKVKLFVFNEINCSDTTQQTIYVVNEVLWIPQAFTPNYEINNTFDVKGSSLASYEIIIYNRWGEQIFYSNDITNSWDGTYKGRPCMKDHYVYHIRYSHVNNPNEIVLKTGTVLLLK